MPILLRNLARVELQDSTKLEVLKMYSHENRNGEVIQNYIYRDGVAFLPLNATKLGLVSVLTGQELVDERSEGAGLKEPFVLNPVFKFREHQVEAAPQFLEHLQKNLYGVLKAGCGCGKSAVNTWVAGHLQKKTLILVDQGNLAGQWQEAFKMVWNKDAAILKSEKDLAADVVISTFQFLNRNVEILKKMKDLFGCCVCDEMQISAATTYKKVLMSLNNRYRIGTTATLMKKGFSNEVLTDLIADISVEMKDSNTMIPEIHFLSTDVAWCSNNPDDFSKILTELSQNDRRNEFIIELIKKEVLRGRRVLFVGARIESLTYLHAKVSEFCAATLYVGSTTLKQDQALKDEVASGNVQVVFADKKIEKGVDVPSLDVLILAKPVNNEATVTQLVGRIVRALQGKPTPIVYDLYDRGNLAWRFAGNRLRWYRGLGYKIIGNPDFSLDTPHGSC